MSTSEESCFRVCVRFLLASASALVSSLGLYPLPEEVEEEEDDGAAAAVGGGGAAVAADAAVAAAAAALEDVDGGEVLCAVDGVVDEHVGDEQAAVAAEAAAAAAALAAAAAAAAAPLLALLLAEELTVESCSWMSIMWSPSLMVRLSGALPERKSTTWKQERRKKVVSESASSFPLLAECTSYCVYKEPFDIYRTSRVLLEGSNWQMAFGEL